MLRKWRLRSVSGLHCRISNCAIHSQLGTGQDCRLVSHTPAISSYAALPLWFCIVQQSWRWHAVCCSKIFVLWQKRCLHRSSSYPAHWHDPRPWQALARRLVVGACLDGHFPIWPRGQDMPFFQRKKNKLEMLICLTNMHIPTMCCSIPGAEKLTGLLDTVRICNLKLEGHKRDQTMPPKALRFHMQLCCINTDAYPSTKTIY